jgi:hypothetical protein
MKKRYGVAITEELEKRLEEERKKRALDSIPEAIRYIMSEYPSREQGGGGQTMRRGSMGITLAGFLFAFVGVGVFLALYFGEMWLLNTQPELPKSLAWQISWPALAIGILGFVVGIASLFLDVGGDRY